MKGLLITLAIIAAIVGVVFLQAYLEIETGTADRPVTELERTR